MNPSVSAPALIEVLRRYYPPALMPRVLRHEASVEEQHLRTHIKSSIWARAREWRSFVQRVEAEFPGCDVSDSPPSYTPSFRCQVTLPGMQPRRERIQEDAVIGMISMLAPVYALYARHWKDDRTEREMWSRYPPLPSEFQAHEAKLAALIESTFGAARVPNDVLFTRVSGLRAPQHPFQEPWLAELLF